MRVALAENAGLMRQSLTRVLDGAGVEVVYAAESGRELLDYLADHAPPAAVMVDIHMADDGLQTAATIKETYPGVGVLVLSNDLLVPYAERLMRIPQPGVGYYGKDNVVDVDVLVHALREVARGQTMIDPSLVAEIFRARAVRTALDKLAEREQEVLALMAEGLANPGIAARLHVSPRTVETYAANIFTKLDIPNTAESNRRVLAVLAWQRLQTVRH